MLGPNYGWAVGGSCDIYAVVPVPGGGCNGFALFWDGARWRNVLVPVGAGTLASVFIVSQNDVWAVGTRNIVAGAATILHWDGVSWVQLPPPPVRVGPRPVRRIHDAWRNRWLAGWKRYSGRDKCSALVRNVANWRPLCRSSPPSPRCP